MNSNWTGSPCLWGFPMICAPNPANLEQFIQVSVTHLYWEFLSLLRQIYNKPTSICWGERRGFHSSSKQGIYLLFKASTLEFICRSFCIVSILRSTSKLTPLNYRCPIKTSNWIRPTLLQKIPLGRLSHGLCYVWQVKVPLYGCDCYAYGLVAAGHVDLVIESGLKVGLCSQGLFLTMWLLLFTVYICMTCPLFFTSLKQLPQHLINLAQSNHPLGWIVHCHTIVGQNMWKSEVAWK